MSIFLVENKRNNKKNKFYIYTLEYKIIKYNKI